MVDGVSFRIETRGLEATVAKLARFATGDRHELMQGLGRLGQEQTRRRIEVEKTTPGGAAWPKTRDGRGALFVTGAHLARSIDFTASASEARWGSGWVGARVHQFGATITPKNAKVLAFVAGGKNVFAKRVTIPSREYVGLSAENEREMIETAERFLFTVLQ